jgi:hypothetical protein
MARPTALRQDEGRAQRGLETWGWTALATVLAVAAVPTMMLAFLAALATMDMAAPGGGGGLALLALTLAVGSVASGLYGAHRRRELGVARPTGAATTSAALGIGGLLLSLTGHLSLEGMLSSVAGMLSGVAAIVVGSLSLLARRGDGSSIARAVTGVLSGVAAIGLWVLFYLGW